MDSLADKLGIDTSSTESSSGEVPLASKLGISVAPTPQPVANQPQAPTDPYADIDPFNDVKNFIGGTAGRMAEQAKAGIPESAQPTIAKVTQPVRSGLELGYDVMETPFRILKTGANKLENLGNQIPNGPTDVTQAILHPEKSATFGDVLSSNPAFMKGQPENVRQSLASKLGVLGEVGYDPINYMGPGIAKGGSLLSKLAGTTVMADEKIPVIGKAIAGAREKVGDATQWLKEGFNPVTSNPAFNEMVARLRQNPTNYETIKVNEEAPELKRIINDHAASMGVTPDELRRNILDVLEPPGSQSINPVENSQELKESIADQKLHDKESGSEAFKAYSKWADSNSKIKNFLMETPDTEPGYRKTLNKLYSDNDQLKREFEKLRDKEEATQIPPEEDPTTDAYFIKQKQDNRFGGMGAISDIYKQNISPDMQAFAQELKDKFQKAQEIERGAGVESGTIENYVPHVMTPELKQFIQKNIPKENHSQILGLLDNPDKSFTESRGVPYTINEINNLAAQGKLGEAEGMGGFKKLNEYKGKVFNDQIEDLAADRYLKSQKIANENDFLKATAKTYGKPFEAVRMSDKPTDFVAVTRPDFKGLPGADDNGKMWFPREIGNYLNRAQELKTGPALGMIMKGMQGINNFTKAMNFGIWPASASKIEVGNQALAWLSDLWDPHSQFLGHSIAAKIRHGGVEALDDTRPVIMAGRNGGLTEKQIYQLAQQNRGIGMGLFRQELPSFHPQENTANPWKVLTGTGWKVHNYVEDGTRMGTFINALKQGNDPFKAGQLTQKALYDYSAMGPIPQAMRRYAPFPFLTFAYKNLPAMAGKAMTNPGKFFAYEKAKDMIQGRGPEQNQYWKEWQAENMPIPIHTDKNGQVYYLFAGHLLPQTDLNAILGSGKTLGEAIANTPGKWPKYALGMVNPFVRTPLELMFNKSTYFDQPIQRMQGEKQPTGLGFNAPAKTAYAIRNLVRPPAEIGRATNESVPLPLRVMRALGGVNVQQVDPQMQKAQAEREWVGQVRGGGKTGGQSDVRRYQIQMAINQSRAEDAKARGDMGSYREFKSRADLAEENMETAIKNLKETVANQPE